MPPYQLNNTELYYKLIDILNDNIVKIRKQNVRLKWEKIVEDSLYSYKKLCKNSKNTKIKTKNDKEESFLNESTKYSNVKSSNKTAVDQTKKSKEVKTKGKNSKDKYVSFNNTYSTLSDSSISELNYKGKSSKIKTKEKNKEEKNEFTTTLATIATDETEITKTQPVKSKKIKKKEKGNEKSKKQDTTTENEFLPMTNPNLITPHIMTGQFPQYPVFGYQPFYHPQLQVPSTTYLNYPMTQIIPQNYIMPMNNLQPTYQMHPMHVIATNCKLPVVNVNNPINYHFTDNKLSNTNGIVPPRNITKKELL